MSAAVHRDLPQSAQAEADLEGEADRSRSFSTEDQINTEISGGADLRARDENAIAPAWNTNGRARHSPDAISAQRHLRCHPAGMPACARGVCIPAFLIGQWLAQMDPNDARRADAEDDVRAFVQATVDALQPGPVGDDPLKFWRSAWEAKHGTRAAAKPGKLSAVKETQQNAKVALEALRNRRDNGPRTETHPRLNAPANRH